MTRGSMSDNSTTTTKTSWGSRIMSSFAGIIFGLIIFLGSFGVIWWNEGRSVDRIKTLNEGRGLVIAVSAARVNSINQDALIHISGTATSDNMVEDTVFGIQETALKLRRKVEMYQWKQTSTTKTTKNLGGSETQETTYSYSKAWSSDLINSAEFKRPSGHYNPDNMPHSDRSVTADGIYVGMFKLGTIFVSQISKFVDYPLTEANFAAMDEDIKHNFILNGNEYFSGNPASPSIGALRVRFTITHPSEVSLIGRQFNDSVETYKTQNGTLNLLQMQLVDPAEMFDDSESSNSVVTWFARLGAFIAMWSGITIIFAPIRVLGDVVPILGRILGAGIGFVAFILALVLSILTMALAWVFFRPIIGLSLLAVAAVFLFGGFRLISQKLKKLSLDDDQQPAEQAPEA